ncbi:hypothetical protein [Azospirillum sp. B510]|uniref:hypothetical protein n=1 Tax=Azospirillum sp. (strain B510) TaxID=137722 RepID=UPI0002E83CA4|nr:hypothetical protein [Azospirillum sp. B510]
MTPSQNILVREFRQILVWPFSLEGGRATDPRGLREEAVKALAGGGWTEIPRLLDHLGTAGDGQGAYQEFVYFHPFVRDFLYGKNGESDEIRLFRCTGCDRLDATFGTDADAFTVEFQVERANLYLFDAGIAVLALELRNNGGIIAADGPQPMRLHHAQTIQERLRRAYPPYWDSEGRAGLMPTSVRWRCQDGRSSPGHAPPSPAAMIGPTVELGEPPLAGHWAALLKPLLSRDQVHIRQVVDDRIPQMLYLRVDNPAEISRGDWVRLANCDEPGDLPCPYAEDFLSDFETRHCYDRHWITNERGGVNTARASRYLFSGYGFVAVGGEANGFFKTILPTHFRRHYFQLALLAQFEYAALLAESHRLADAETPKDVERGLKRVLDFTRKYWFVDVSNQIQAREMYALWRGSLNTKALYDQVREEARAAAEYRDATESRQATEATTRLTIAALLVAVPSLATGFLGINLISFSSKKFDGWPAESLDWALQALGGALVTVAVLAGLAWTLAGLFKSVRVRWLERRRR